MTFSMTAFGRTSLDGESGNYTCEIRTVNHRYLEVNIRLPDELRQFESHCRQIISEKLNRGRVDCYIKKVESNNALESANINTSVLNQLTKLASQVNDTLDPVQPLRMIDVLRWPNVLETPEVPENVVKNEAAKLMTNTLDRVVVSRQSEGEKLETLIQLRLDEIDGLITKVTALIPEVNNLYRSKITEKLAQVKDELDESRVEQEMIIFLQKSDIAEEIDRLKVHVNEVRKTLSQNKPVGRRLDFLMQELNREANTLGSKSHNAELTNHAVDLKVLIEQMREQVQNIE